MQVQVPVGFADDDDDDVDAEAGACLPDAEDHAWIDLEPLDGPVIVARAPDPPVMLAEAAVEPLEDLGRLRVALADGTLGDELRERIIAWLMSAAQDPDLEQVLGELGDNPLQVGFDLLSKST